MSRGEGVRPADLCADWNANEPAWRAPVGLRFSDVAQSYLSHRVAQHLRSRGYKAKNLSHACGGSEAAWRSKLNGNRLFSLADLMDIAAVLDMEVLGLLTTDGEGPTALVPAPYEKYLSRDSAGRVVFRDPGTDWGNFAANLATWLERENAAGRAEHVTTDVLAHRVLHDLSELGLPSGAAARETTAGGTSLEWLEPSVRLDIFAVTRPSTLPAARKHLQALGNGIWALATASTARVSIFVALIPDLLASKLAAVLAPSGRPLEGWKILSLAEAHRLGHTATVDISDISVRPLVHLSSGVLALEVKT